MYLALICSHVVIVYAVIFTFLHILLAINFGMLVKQVDLFVPSLGELASVLQHGLTRFYKDVSVTVRHCPDLSEPPFGLSGKGLCGNQTLLDIGGVKNLLPMPDLSKIWKISDVVQSCGLSKPLFVMGAGAGPHHISGKNCELIANSCFDEGSVAISNRLVSLDSRDEKSYVNICQTDDFALMLNLFSCDGQTGEVLEVICETRLADSKSDDHNFANHIRQILLEYYGSEKPVGLGGVFLFEKGTAQVHVMPGFSDKPLKCEAEVDSWLKFFNIEAPLVACGELISHDPGFNLRLEHFHCFKPGSSTDGGHFHIDTTPSSAKYRAYFNVANRVMRVDKP